jgi:hypothetical protein
MEKIDPEAIWWVDVALNASRAEFSHSLDPLRSIASMAADVRARLH